MLRYNIMHQGTKVMFQPGCFYKKKLTCFQFSNSEIKMVARRKRQDFMAVKDDMVVINQAGIDIMKDK